MIPKGIELDKAIAKMRGEGKPDYSCRLLIEGECPYDDFGGEEDCPDKCDYLKPDYKPYHSSIVHAMELWDLMKAAGLILELNYVGFNNCILYEDETKLGTEEVILVGTANTEAEAISSAYYKWGGK